MPGMAPSPALQSSRRRARGRPAAAAEPALNALRGRPYVVVGAGVQGLTFGYALAARGLPVAVFERSGEIGGQARSFEYDGFVFDFGLHAFVSRDARVLSLVRGLLGADFHAFQPRAVSRLRNGALIEDLSAWWKGGEHRPLCDLVGAGGTWNCMRVSVPPRIVYPRRGGFGRICAELRRGIEARGGAVLLGSSLGADALRVRHGRLEAIRVEGEEAPVRGCYWSVGTRFLDGRPSAPSNFLLLYHLLVRGRPSLPYHWVRLSDRRRPLLPQLAYYPTAFSPFNAPPGFHGIGAVVPVEFPAGGRGGGLLQRWLVEDPSTLADAVLRYLGECGVVDPEAVLGTRVERLPVPPERHARSGDHPYASVEGFWDSDAWLLDEPGESGVALQMRAALAAADAVAREGSRA